MAIKIIARKRHKENPYNSKQIQSPKKISVENVFPSFQIKPEYLICNKINKRDVVLHYQQNNIMY